MRTCRYKDQRKELFCAIAHGDIRLDDTGHKIIVSYFIPAVGDFLTLLTGMAKPDETWNYIIALKPELKDDVPDGVNSAIIAMLKSGKASKIQVDITKQISVWDPEQYEPLVYSGFKKTALALHLLLFYKVRRFISGK